MRRALAAWQRCTPPTRPRARRRARPQFRGYFFCGSSGRCVGRDDPCEDGSGAAAATCGATLKRDGAVASWDLKGLTRTSSLLDYEAKDGASKVIFNVCANANPPKACPSSNPAAAYAITKQSCKAVAGSAADADMASLKPLVGADPTAGRGLGLVWPGPVLLSAAGAVLGIRRRAV